MGILTNGSPERLYGLTVHQTYRYFKLYPGDRLFLKTLVRLSPLSYSSRTLNVHGICQVLIILYVHSHAWSPYADARLTIC